MEKILLEMGNVALQTNEMLLMVVKELNAIRQELVKIQEAIQDNS